jgi:hypothetical protein
MDLISFAIEGATVQDFEKLGVFYLGKLYDLASSKRGDDLVLYDSKDLTTHAMIIGMTGSGKTGLGIAMLEEAAIDRIPVIAIDPKGDLTNLLLTFPNLQPSDFQPWVNVQEATTKGVTVEQFAASTAETWQKGLADWGQSGERIQRLRDTVDLAIYTPGSSAGLPISVLQSFSCPPPQVRDDTDLYRERIQATASSVLGLMGIEADPVTSREHVLLANIVQHAWQNNQDLDLATLIGSIQAPPFQRIGVLDVNSFMPEKERFALAMQLNTLLAAPGFEAWMQGEPLDSGRLLFSENGKPRLSVMSIAHLGDRERMFFVSMLLNDLVSWMRQQPGTGSLRAILYMDEIFGYMPPTANPPTKSLMLLLLKQARAFGLGLVLSTQNPVDLDYKGLSNIGTWFIGRLQTERDKARVMEGLEGAAAGGAFDKAAMEQTLAGLGKRVFLMRNVHEDQPVVFTTRWVLSYLAGPLTRDQIRQLMGTSKSSTPAPKPALAVTPKPQTSAISQTQALPVNQKPVLPQSITAYFLPVRRSTRNGEVVYQPQIIAAADVTLSSSKFGIQETRRTLRLGAINDGPVPLDWAEAQAVDLTTDDLEREGLEPAQYADLPGPAARAKSYDEWEKLLARWLRTGETMTLLESPTLKAISKPGESERDFRIRLQQLAREARDEQLATLRKRYQPKIAQLEERLRKAEDALAREQAEASQQKWDIAASVGGSLLGALFGRKRGVSTSRIGSSVGRLQRGSQDVNRAEESVVTVQNQLVELENELQAEITHVENSFDALAEQLSEVVITPKAGDVVVHFVALAWVPYLRDEQGMVEPLWR